MENTDSSSDAKTGGDRAKVGWMDKVSRIWGDSSERDAENQEDTRTNNGSEGELTKAGKGRVFPVNATEFVTALGLGLLFALLRTEFSTSTFFAGTLSIDSVYAEVADVLGLMTFCVTIVVCWRYSDWLAHYKRGRLCIFGSASLAALALAQCVLQAIGISGWFVPIIIEGVCGIPYAIILVLWIEDIWVLKRVAAVRVLLLALCIAAVFVALLAVIQTPLFRHLAIAVYLVLTGFSYLAAGSHIDVDGFVSREETRQNIKFDMRTSVSLFIAAVADGFCMCLAMSFGEESFLVVAIAFFIAAIFVGVGMVFFGDRGVLLSTIFRWTFPMLTFGFIFIPFVSGCLLRACITFVLAVCFACLLSLFVTLVQVKYRFKVQPIYACARVLLPWALGVLAGLVMGIVTMWVEPSLEGMLLTALSMFIILLFAVSMAVAPYGIDMLTMPIEPDEEEEEPEEESREVHAWKSACDRLAKEGGLTPREVDVFMLLAKGRNAKVIERELFISVYTIKGHNNNIYRKLGVKSQQELIDLVENYRREIWKPKMDLEQGGEHE